MNPIEIIEKDIGIITAAAFGEGLNVLQARGWRLIHPDTFTDEMRRAMNHSDFLNPLAWGTHFSAAIKAAPKYGEGE